MTSKITSPIDSQNTSLVYDSTGNITGIVNQAGKVSSLVPTYPTIADVPAGFDGKAIIGNLEVLSNGNGIRTKNTGSAGRPTFSFFGCSIAGLNTRKLYTSVKSTSTISRSKQKVITLDNTTGFAVNDRVAVGILSGTYIITTVTASDNLATSSTITIANKLPQMFQNGGTCFVQKLTTERPTNLREAQGPFISALSMLGHPCEVLPGFQFYGGKTDEMLPFLSAYLTRYKPNFMMMPLLENDIKNGYSAANIQYRLSMFINACLSNNTIPIITSCFPQSGYTTGNIAVFDAMYQYVMDIGNSFPGAIGIDCSTLWQDKTNGNRAPLAGWTDGVHPLPQYWKTIGAMLYSELQPLVGTRSTHSDIALEFFDMKGTGGTNSGGGTLNASPAISTGFNLTVGSTLVVTATKDSNDHQHIDFNAPGIADGHTLILSNTAVNVPASWGGQNVKAFVRFKILSTQNINSWSIGLAWDDGSVINSGSDTNSGLDQGWTLGQYMVLETPATMIPANVSTFVINITAGPVPGGTAGSVSGSFVVQEMGLTLASDGEMFIIQE